jgi:hypothetical protein
VPLINWIIAHTLANQVGADGETLQVILVENVPAALNVAIVLQGFVYLEVVAPTGKFQAVEPPFADLLSQRL